MHFLKFLMVPWIPPSELVKYSEKKRGLNLTYTPYTFNDRIITVRIQVAVLN